MIICPACGHKNLSGAEECEQCQESLAAAEATRPSPGLQKRILEGNVSDLQPHKALTVTESENTGDAVRLMRQNKTGCVLVMDRRRLRGILTERDLLFGAADKPEPLKVPAKAVMHADPDVVKASDPVAVAFHKMAVGGYRHLPVLNEDGSYGVISARDLLRYLCQ